MDGSGDGMTAAAYLAPGTFIDSDHPAVRSFAETRSQGAESATQAAVRLYGAVRDEIIYDPYRIHMTPDGFRASHCLVEERGFCITKAALLAAAARAVGIPARVGYADVRNHLATRRLRELMGTDTFIWHGYAELLLEGRWVKATPAFNLSLCERFRVLPLDFDGRNDSVFHPFDADGRRHMEYLADRGHFADVPFDAIIADLVATYPDLMASEARDFAAEAAAENG